MKSDFWGGGRGHTDEESKSVVSRREGISKKMASESCMQVVCVFNVVVFMFIHVYSQILVFPTLTP